MRCNVTDCYWNMWSPRHPYTDELSKQCVSENLDAHFDEDEDFKMTPNSKTCEGYLNFYEFRGDEKEG
ncbi:hypothetical protein SAMN05216235_2729 [Salinicoccus halodurans]|uniref:Uncharacterized protein n=1 Tax=Salinicoccus halodurans TaxID=407035 RepID=A0A0F7HLX3_9STAP|nr:hypothetical protein AAT16_09155 [Salinicoccus halodurans]SFK95268.1 hypothetical protein SAMN05216235_2729 [Salinicoccus halodurans]